VRSPLAPPDFYPAGHLEISQRFLSLPTGVTLRVAERGPRDGIPVVMLPGWGTPLYTYRHALERLPAHGARAIAVDLRGSGLSSKPMRRGTYSLDAHCADLDALLDALEIPRAFIIGQSMGGGLTLRYAQRRGARVAGMVLINPTGLASLTFLPLLRVLPRAPLSLVGRRLVPRALVRFVLRHLAYGNAALVTEHDIDEYWAPTQLPGYVYAARSGLSEFDWRSLSAAETATLTAPALVILGDADRLVRNSASGAALLPNATVRTLSGGHCVHEELPDLVYHLVGDFIRSAWRR
jgi:pimeloyl-ACP methyl ester carboxylesterase